MCCIHYGHPSRHITLTFDTHPPQHLLPVSFDTVARELPPRTPFHRFARWKSDMLFIIQTLIDFRVQEREKERAPCFPNTTVLFFTSSSTDACHCLTAEDGHYHLLNPSLHQHCLRIFTSNTSTKSSSSGCGRKIRYIYSDIYLLVFTRLITH